MLSWYVKVFYTVVAEGISLVEGGVILTSTGGGAVIGIPAIEISVPVVAVGVLEMAGTASIAYSGYSNMNDHIQKINEINSSPDKPDIGDIKKAELADEVKETGESMSSPKGLIGHDFEDYLTRTIGGKGSFNTDGREFDGSVGGRWWEAKSGFYWDLISDNPNQLAKFKSDMGDRLRIAKSNGATYELFSNTPIPDEIKQWLLKKGIPFTELLD